MSKSKSTKFKLITLIMFFLLIIVNALADALPINQVTTSEISSIHPTLITPAEYTFFIWIVIYILLGAFTLYQLKPETKSALSDKQFNELRYYFCLSCVGNILWLFSWHYNMIDVSAIVMLMLFYCILSAVKLLHTVNTTHKDELFLNISFELYLGWIMAALIVNIAVFLESLDWYEASAPGVFWSVVLLVLGMLICTASMLRNKSIYIGIGTIWAYFGILVKHFLNGGFQREYLSITIVTILCIGVLMLIQVLVYKKK